MFRGKIRKILNLINLKYGLGRIWRVLVLCVKGRKGEKVGNENRSTCQKCCTVETSPARLSQFLDENAKKITEATYFTRPQNNNNNIEPFYKYSQMRRNALSIWFSLQTVPNPNEQDNPNALKPFGRTKHKN